MLIQKWGTPDFHMVSTGLVMLRMKVTLGMLPWPNFYLLQLVLTFSQIEVLMLYWIILPINYNLTPQERGNMMELVNTLRFIMSWWKDPSILQYLPQWLKEYSIRKPCGVLDGRGQSNSQNIFINWLINRFPGYFYLLPMLVQITSWTKNSPKTMFVFPEECRKNIASMDPTCWYSL